ncbi:TetR/AcrR family transcriptional regulator [Microbacterium sp. gxy059]|uniref:TetR/AcrR family transcriptional regulator n=1 Tax=Microbacterium sp. gxy059 TaxID=2957199 RepID=UPI003D99FEEF
MSDAGTPTRRRMSYDERHLQLRETARALIRDEGTDAFTLARLADRAGVTKPLVYQHFGTRSAVLVELYREFKGRAHLALDAALATTGDDLDEVARVIADAYLDCIDAESTEVPGVGGALSGSAELEDLRQEADDAFSARCRAALAPSSPDGGVPDAALHVILGAADALARAILRGRIGFDDARRALAKTVAGVV